MKKSTCRALGGACDAELLGDTPEAMGVASKNHVMEMVQAGDQAHIDAMNAWKEKTTEEMKQFFNDFVAGFDALPEA